MRATRKLHRRQHAYKATLGPYLMLRTILTKDGPNKKERALQTCCVVCVALFLWSFKNEHCLSYCTLSWHINPTDNQFNHTQNTPMYMTVRICSAQFNVFRTEFANLLALTRSVSQLKCQSTVHVKYIQLLHGYYDNTVFSFFLYQRARSCCCGDFVHVLCCYC